MAFSSLVIPPKMTDPRPDRCSGLHPRQLAPPIPVLENLAIPIASQRPSVIVEHDAVPNKDLIFDRHSFTNEGMA